MNNTQDTITRLERLPDTVQHIALHLVDLTATIGHVLDGKRTHAADLLHWADGIVAAFYHIDEEHELRATAPGIWEASRVLSDSEREDVSAIGIILELQNLANAPDVVARLLQRLHRKVVDGLLGVEPVEPLHLRAPLELKASTNYLSTLAMLERDEYPTPDQIKALELHDQVVRWVVGRAVDDTRKQVLDELQQLVEAELERADRALRRVAQLPRAVQRRRRSRRVRKAVQQ